MHATPHPYNTPAWNNRCNQSHRIEEWGQLHPSNMLPKELCEIQINHVCFLFFCKCQGLKVPRTQKTLLYRHQFEFRAALLFIWCLWWKWPQSLFHGSACNRYITPLYTHTDRLTDNNPLKFMKSWEPFFKHIQQPCKCIHWQWSLSCTSFLYTTFFYT